MGKLVAEQFEISSSASVTAVSKSDSGQSLPHWLQLCPGRTAKSGSTNNPDQVSLILELNTLCQTHTCKNLKFTKFAGAYVYSFFTYIG